MACSKFTMAQLRREYHLEVSEQSALFAAAPPAAISDLLRETLRRKTILAPRSGSEKARYGVVTSGEVWKFLRLQGTHAVTDTDDYYLDNVEKIVGIILSMLR